MTIFKDPYKVLDPTTHETPMPEQGRTMSGRYGVKSVLNAMTDDHFPIESRYWSNGAKGEFGLYQKLSKLIPKTNDYWHLVDSVLPPEVIEGFSWRMIYEMFYSALDALNDGKTIDEAIGASHDWLKHVQWETAMKLRPDGDSEALNQWMIENWGFIPEEEL
jgi:hypothetical protein